MSWFSKFEEGSRTILLVAQSSAAMRRRFVMGAVGLVAVLGVGGYFLHKHSTEEAHNRVAAAWSSLDHCLLGAPLSEGEKPSMRFRAVQLGALAQTIDMASEKEQWPTRCAAHAHALRDGLVGTTGTPEDKSLAHWADKLAAALSATGSASADSGELVDQTWAQASKEGLVSNKDQATGPEPPSPLETLTIDALKNIKSLTKNAPALDSIQSDQHAYASLDLVLEETKTDQFLWCSLGAEAKSIRCNPLASSIPASQLGMRLLGTSDDKISPLLFVGARGSEGIFRVSDGEKITAATSLGAHASQTITTVLAWDEGAKRISAIQKTGESAPRTVAVRLEDKLKVAQPQRDIHLLWDHILFRGANRFEETWLASAQIKSGSIDTPVDIGLLPEAGANRPASDTDLPIVGCRTDKSRVVRVRGDSHDFLSFYVADKWTKPVKTSKTGGNLSCRRVEAWLTHFDSLPGAGILESTISVEKCTPASCKASQLSIEEMFKGALALAPASPPLIGQVDGKILVVWTGGERGGLRMRLAPLEELEKASDTVLFDDLVKDGTVQKTSTLADVRLFARESFAVLLLRTSEGLHALHIDGEGKVSPLQVDG